MDDTFTCEICKKEKSKDSTQLKLYRGKDDMVIACTDCAGICSICGSVEPKDELGGEFKNICAWCDEVGY